jgi:hypothetical protein
MEIQGLLEVDHHHPKEEWKSVTTTSGALSVMTHGIVWMPVLLVCNLAIALKVHRKLYYHIVMIINNYHEKVQPLKDQLRTDKELDLFY